MKIEESLDKGDGTFLFQLFVLLFLLTLALLASGDDGPIVCFLPSTIIYSFPYALCSIIKCGQILWLDKRAGTLS